MNINIIIVVCYGIYLYRSFLRVIILKKHTFISNHTAKLQKKDHIIFIAKIGSQITLGQEQNRF